MFAKESHLFEKCLTDFNEEILFSHEKQLSYLEWYQNVCKTAQWLKSLGLGEKALVLINLQDPEEFLTVSFACMIQKMIPCLINTFFKESQIEAITNDNCYDFVISDIKKDIQDLPEELFSFEKVKSFPPIDNKIPLDSKMIFYSSGSVQCKACVLTLKNFFFNALGSSENIPFQHHDKWGASLPLFHVGGFSIFVRTLLARASAHWIDKEGSLVEQIQKNNITHLSLVSTQLVRLVHELRETKAKLPSLKYVLLGGSSIAQHHIAEAIELGLPILKSYGMTEMASQICTTHILKKTTDSSGKLLSYREFKVENQNILIRGPCLFNGYMKDNTVSLPLDKHGWFSTNDLGEFKENEIFITGRKDRIFQSGGENISPELIEKEILKIEGIEKVYVIPEVDTEYGMRAIAYLDKSKNILEEHIQKILKEKLSLFWRPKEFRPWDQLPKKSWKQL